MKAKGNGFKKYLKKHSRKSANPYQLGIGRLRDIQAEVLKCKTHPIKTRAVCFMILERMIENQNVTKIKRKKELSQNENEKINDSIFIGCVDF